MKNSFNNLSGPQLFSIFKLSGWFDNFFSGYFYIKLWEYYLNLTIKKSLLKIWYILIWLEENTIKYSVNVLADKPLGIRVCVFAASFRSFQYSFAFMYLALISRLVFAFSSSDSNCLTVILKSVLFWLWPYLILLVSILSFLYLFNMSKMLVSILTFLVYFLIFLSEWF